RMTAAAQLQDRDRVRIGETEIEYSEKADTAPTGSRTSILLSDSGAGAVPEATITAESRKSASDLLSSLEAVQRTQIRPAPGQIGYAQDDTLAIISRVSLTLLSPLSLEETLEQVLDCVFAALPADRAYMLLLEKREADGEPELVCKALKSRSIAPNSLSQVEISRSISEQVLNHGVSVLTQDALHDPRFQEHRSIALGGIRSVMA